MKVVYDGPTKKWFRKGQNWNVETTVMRCAVCGLFYKPSLGHKCPKDRKGKEDHHG